MLLHKWLMEATRQRGSAKALVYRDTYLSWRGLQHRVERRVQEFGAMGIGKGQWVGLMLGNVPDFAILALALSKIGATVVPLDPTTGTRDLALILEYAPLRAVYSPVQVSSSAPGPVLSPGRSTKYTSGLMFASVAGSVDKSSLRRSGWGDTAVTVASSTSKSTPLPTSPRWTACRSVPPSTSA